MKIDSIFPEPELRKWVQDHNLPDVLYLAIALLTSTLFLFIWGILALSYKNELSFFIFFVGLTNGFLAYLFMHYQNKTRLTLYSAVITLGVALLAKFFYYSHYFNWELSSVLNKDHLNFGLLFTYLKHFQGVNDPNFINYVNAETSIMGWICILIAMMGAKIYFFFNEEDEENAIEKIQKKANDQRIIKKKFDF